MVLRLEARGQAADIGNLELAVAIGERKQLVARRLKPRAQRATVPAVGVVVDHPHNVWVGCGKPICDLACLVTRPVVDGDDLKRLRERGQRLERLGHKGLDVGLLVVGREEVREARDLAG